MTIDTKTKGVTATPKENLVDSLTITSTSQILLKESARVELAERRTVEHQGEWVGTK